MQLRRERQQGRGRFPSTISAAMLIGLLCGVLTACAPDVRMPVPSTTPSATAVPAGDGILTIGTLFPTTGDAAGLSRTQAAAVELAVREINEAGGVNGAPVVVYHEDSGDTSTAKAEESFAALVSKGVDVVIGPSTLELAERLLPKAVEAGVVMMLTTVTSPAVSTLNDDGFLFRTVPSEALEGTALADAIGDRRVAIVYQSVDPDRAVRDEFVKQLEKVGGEVVASEGYSVTTSDVDLIVASVSSAEPDVVVLTSPPNAMEKHTELILALSNAGFSGSKLWLTSRNLVDYAEVLPEGTLTGVQGVKGGAELDAEFQKRVKSADPSVADFDFAAEAYDATIMAALAAIIAKSDSGHSVALKLADVSASGIKCTSFGECIDVVASRPDIDYDGVSGPISFDSHGDPGAGIYGVFEYGIDNSLASVVTLRVE